MPSSLADPYLKTARAKEHLEELRSALDAFRKDRPCTFRREDDLVRQLHIVHIKTKPIPDKIPLIAGDFLYCLRSSLDQLVWALAKDVGNYPSGTQFPIMESFREQTFDQWTAGIPAEAKAIIYDLQPCHGRDEAEIRSNLLSMLNRLCNIDKHRRIPADATAVDFRFPKFPRKFLHLARFDNDGEMVIVPLALKPYMALDPTGSIDIFFGDSYEKIGLNFDGLTEIYEFVANNVMPRFTRFFKQPVGSVKTSRLVGDF